MNDDLAVATDGDHQRRGIAAAARRAELTAPQLWLRYFALGGGVDPAQVEDYLRDGELLPAAQADLLAQAVNERFDELLRLRRAPYSRPVRETRPQRGPLASLVELLDGTRGEPPERLPRALAAAGASIGVGITAYLVDYEQRRLVPVLSPGERRVPLEVASTLAGRASRQVETLPAEAGGPRLWVPLLDGTERLGVLEVLVDRPDDLYDPALREQCRWIAAVAGHVVVSTTGYGDALDALRRSRPRTSAAELIWKLLPPLTAGTPELEVAGLLEPAYAVGGDAFDYSLGVDTAAVSIFDAAGHSLLSGMVAAAALAAYRAARRAGAGLSTSARTAWSTWSAGRSRPDSRRRRRCAASCTPCSTTRPACCRTTRRPSWSAGTGGTRRRPPPGGAPRNRTGSGVLRTARRGTSGACGRGQWVPGCWRVSPASR